LLKSNIKQAFNYHNPVIIKFGYGLYLNNLQDIIGADSKRIGLFYGSSSMKRAGVIDSIKDRFSACKIDEFGSISSNPDISDVKEFIVSNKDDFDLMIAVGGGSVIDFAKSVSFLLRQPGDLEDCLTGRARAVNSSIPLIAVPTTSGTGTEVTPWASLWKRGVKKYSLSNKFMFPAYAVVDPSLTLTLPLEITAYTAFDALSHAFEALWSKHSNPVSDIFAFEAVSIIMEDFEKLIDDLNNPELRYSMSKASLYAGLAFSNTKTAAVHSVSYPMTLHFGVPHGTACSLLLGEFLEYNQEFIEESKLKTILNASNAENISEIKKKFYAFAEKGGLPKTLKEAGVPEEGMEVILNEGFDPDRISNNPREVSRKDLRRILEKIYD